MYRYQIYWLDGSTEQVIGKSPAEAMYNAGIGSGALAAMDFYEKSDYPTYYWGNGQWVKKE